MIQAIGRPESVGRRPPWAFRRSRTMRRREIRATSRGGGGWLVVAFLVLGMARGVGGAGRSRGAVQGAAGLRRRAGRRAAAGPVSAVRGLRRPRPAVRRRGDRHQPARRPSSLKLEARPDHAAGRHRRRRQVRHEPRLRRRADLPDGRALARRRPSTPPRTPASGSSRTPTATARPTAARSWSPASASTATAATSTARSSAPTAGSTGPTAGTATRSRRARGRPLEGLAARIWRCRTDGTRDRAPLRRRLRQPGRAGLHRRGRADRHDGPGPRRLRCCTTSRAASTRWTTPASRSSRRTGPLLGAVRQYTRRAARSPCAA